MFGSEVIDVGIGTALLFLFMSLIATALREFIENFMKSRSKDLERGIKELLQEGKGNAVLTAKLYDHPLIASLYKGGYSDKTRDLPSYIPRQNFSSAILDIVAKASETGSPLSFKSLTDALAKAPTPNAVQRVVLTALTSAQGDLDAVKKALEDWYDGTMDRVAGWYTRRTGKILFVLGLLAAIFFNVDAITVVEHLIKDKALRAAVVAQAEKAGPANADKSHPAPPDQSVATLTDDFEKIGFPIGWVRNRGGVHPYPGPQFCRPDPASEVKDPPDYLCRSVGANIIPVFFGWVITALAITLGAPFWFDVLNKFMIVRSTIKPKEKSPDEASTDRQSGDAKKPGGGGAAAANPDGPPDAGENATANVMAGLALRSDAFEPHEWANDADPQRGVM